MSRACPTCGKGYRAMWYCRRSDCGLQHSAVDLPSPDVSVTTTENGEGGTDLNVTISREGKGRLYSVNNTGGGTEPIKKVIERIITDPYTAEWVPKK